MTSNNNTPDSQGDRRYGGVHLRSRRGGRSLQLDLFADGQRLRKHTGLADTAANRERLKPVVEKLAAARTLGLVQSTPDFIAHTLSGAGIEVRTPPDPRPAYVPFARCARAWILRTAPQWRDSTTASVRGIVETHLVRTFGQDEVRCINREQILEFRARIAAEILPGGAPRSRRTVNAIVAVLAAILAEECVRLGIPSPAAGIKRLRVRKPEIQPFRLDQLHQVVETIAPRWRDYILVWAYTGLRTAEINGLKWSRVDLDRGRIEIRETWSKGRTDVTKSESGTRDVVLSVPVIEALRHQRAVTGGGTYVFTGPGGTPIDARNFSRRVWTPLLRRLGLAVRRPYQLRHTYATLMLAAGENPEYIARQLGHADTAMLFTVYSRFVPNLTRRDGSAFERLLADTRRIPA